MRIKQSISTVAMAAVALLMIVGAVPAASAATPVATGVAMSSGAHSFKDINSRSAFRTEIMWLADRGISTGYADGTFRPFGVITRDAMAAFMYRLAGEPAFTPPTRSPFKDITPSTQFYKEITWLARTDVTTGYADDTYRPYDSVTRDAMAAFMYRLAGKPSYKAPARSPFKDIQPDSKFYKEVTWLASTGISTGWSSSKTYRPFQSIERNAMAAFMHRFHRDVGVNVVARTNTDGRVQWVAGHCGDIPTRTYPLAKGWTEKAARAEATAYGCGTFLGSNGWSTL